MGNYYYVGETAYKTICINEHEYQVPEAVATYLQSLDDTLEAERQAHAKEVSKLQKVATKDFNIVADRIMTNLNSGLEPLKGRWGLPTFDVANRCLVYDVNEHFKTDSFGEPIFEFKHEVKRRIMAALMGQTANGQEYK